MSYTLEFYERTDGSIPVEEFISAQPAKMKAKIYSMLSLLETNGSNLREPYSKMLEDGILELRIQQASNIARVLYFFISGETIILTNGFIKKSRKTPPGEITRAKTYRADYYSRQKK